MRSAQSCVCVLPTAGTRRCKINHRGIEGEHRAQCARVRRCREEHTIIERQSWGPSSDSGLMMENWESQSKKSPPRVRKTDTFIVFYLFVLHSVTCLKTCHFNACFTSLWTSISFSMLILHATSSRFCLYLLNNHHFTYIFSHAHTEAYTHKHTCIISTQEEWRQLGAGAWLRGVEERLLLETKAPRKKRTQMLKKKPIFTNLKKNIRAHRASSKATIDYFLRSNQSNINLID